VGDPDRLVGGQRHVGAAMRRCFRHVLVRLAAIAGVGVEFVGRHVARSPRVACKTPGEESGSVADVDLRATALSLSAARMFNLPSYASFSSYSQCGGARSVESSRT